MSKLAERMHVTLHPLYKYLIRCQGGHVCSPSILMRNCGPACLRLTECLGDCGREWETLGNHWMTTNVRWGLRRQTAVTAVLLCTHTERFRLCCECDEWRQLIQSAALYSCASVNISVIHLPWHVLCTCACLSVFPHARYILCSFTLLTGFNFNFWLTVKGRVQVIIWVFWGSLK